MSDETTTALQALIKQVTALTNTVQKQQADLEGIRKHNDRLLDKVMDGKRAPNTDLIDTLQKQERARKMDDAGFVPNADGSWRLASGPGDTGNALMLTREQARDTQTYRAAKERAAKQGVPLRIIEVDGDPTIRNTGKPEIVKSKVFTFDDTHDMVRYIRADMHSGEGNVHRQLAAEREGFRVRTFRTLDDLPGHARTKFDLMEGAANAQSDS